MRQRVLWAIGALLFGAVLVAVVLARLREGVAVEVFVVRRGAVEEVVTAVSAGTVRARREAVISAEVGGRVARVFVREGSTVRPGDRLARLVDPELARQIEAAAGEADQAAELLAQARARRDEAQGRLEAETARAEQNLKRAREERRRTAELHRRGFASDAEDEQAETAVADALAQARLAALGRRTVEAAEREVAALAARLAAARARLDSLRERAAKLEVAAPFAGVITKKSVEEGEAKAPGAPLFVLADPSDLFVEAQVDESESAKVRPGQPVRLFPDAYLGEVFRGVISRVRPTVEVSREVSRANTVEIRPLAPPKPLRVGMSADVEIVVGRREDVLWCPTGAILERDGRKAVLVVAGGRVARREVVTGISNWEKTEIVSGLAPGDGVITSLEGGALAPGTRVTVRARR